MPYQAAPGSLLADCTESAERDAEITPDFPTVCFCAWGMIRSGAKVFPAGLTALHPDLLGLPYDTPSGQPVDLDTVEHHFVMLFLRQHLPGTGKPPFLPELEQLFRPPPHVGVLRPAFDFVIPPEHEHGCPKVLASDLLDFQADFRILAHPLNLLTDRCEGVEAASLGIERKMNRDDVRLVDEGTAESSDGALTEELRTLVRIQFVDQHRHRYRPDVFNAGYRRLECAREIRRLHIMSPTRVQVIRRSSRNVWLWRYFPMAINGDLEMGNFRTPADLFVAAFLSLRGYRPFSHSKRVGTEVAY
jgi:hypothetical protein